MTETFVYSIYIKTTPEKLWTALTDGSFSEKYWMGFRIESDWKPGSPVAVRNQTFHGGKFDLEGKVLECDPPRKLVYTFASPSDPLQESRNGPSRVTYELIPVGALMRLTLTHENLLPEDLEKNPGTLKGINNGWPAIFSGLKSLLETGEQLQFDIGKLTADVAA